MAKPAYNGPWPKIRLAVLARDGYICQIRLPGCTIRATCVDHIIGLQQGGKAWDPRNCQAACRKCNTAKGNQQNPRPQPWHTPPSRIW